MGILWQDVRYALRMLTKSPGFTAVAVLTLALGIGANTAIFSVVNAVLLRPLPYPDSKQLVQVRKKAPRAGDPVIGGGSFVEGHEFAAWRQQCRSLAYIAAFGGSDMNLTGVNQAERVLCGNVTADFFPMLGARPALGRLFLRDEEQPGGPDVAVLSHGLWRRHFGGDPSILGRTIMLDHQGYEVVGVLPADFRFIEPYEIWTPMHIDTVAEEGTVAINLFRALAKLRPGATVPQAQAEMTAIAGRASQQFFASAKSEITLPPTGQTDSPTQGAPSDAIVMGTPSGTLGDETANASPLPLMAEAGSVHLVPLQEQLVANVRPALLVLLGAVASVLLIACANVANLLLARTAPRHREIAIRVALGARRWDTVRQLLMESMILGLLGGAAGLLLAVWGIHLLGRFESLRMPHAQAIGVDGAVLAFTLVVSLLVGMIFGVAPALQAVRADVNDVLKYGGSGLGEAPRRYVHRGLLVVAETALAMILLTGAGLLLKSFILLRQVEPGYRPAGLLTFQLNLDQWKFPTAEQRTAFIDRVLQDLQSLPAVQGVAATDHLPLTHVCLMTDVSIEGRPASPFEKDSPVSVATVTPEYFAVMGIATRGGRQLTAADRDGRNVVVNESFARHYLADQNVIGRRIRDFEAHRGSQLGWLTIVGVVADVRQEGLEGTTTPEMYRLIATRGEALVSVILRTSGDPLRLALAIRSRVQTLERDVPVYGLMTMQQRLDTTTAPRRTNLLLLGGFAVLALGLASVGIYSVMSCIVAQRTREIGLRMAMGARTGDVLTWVFRRGMSLVAIGVIAGLVGALLVTRFLASLLFEVKPYDPLTLLAVAALLAGIAAAACYLPARRAARTDPMVALRCE
jgi:putative ABC transport system permease protein